MIEIKTKKFIAELNLNRPPVNALSTTMVNELQEAADKLSEKARASEVRCVILRSACKHFCAGADLKERQSLPSHLVADIVLKIQHTFTKIAEIPVPVIAAMHGSAIGGGLELALAADFRIATDSAKMGLRETALAIIPGAGGTQRLARLIGPSAALYWISTARIFSATEALKWGVVQEVVTEHNLESTVRNIAQGIAANGPVAVRAAKKAIYAGVELPLAEGLELEHEHYKNTIPTKDREEALAAFLEKRKPVFRGK
ncbi:MAG: enoyl-CoA hydratase [Calditrichaeota bacterium]|nr:MAG: enoyl-CoA hydratase [Calditrichota bacterium]